MDTSNVKCVMVIDEALPLGLIANTAAVMGVTLGKQFPETVGCEVRDNSGKSHLGIVTIPIPILRSDQSGIRQIRERLYDPEYSDMVVVDFSDIAQDCKTYEEFMEREGSVREQDLNYLGIAMCGNKKKVNKLTGSMPLLR